MSEPTRPEPIRDRLPTGRTARILVAPFVALEVGLEWASYLLSHLALFDVLRKLAELSVLVAVVSYFLSADERRQAQEDTRKAKHYQAWQMILAADGTTGSAGAGRRDALEDLHGDSVPLDGVIVSGARLQSLQLPGARLDRVWLDSAHLQEANFSGAYLRDATFSGAQLQGASMTNAILSGARFNLADLSSADLSSADLERADLSSADLAGADLDRADLREANLRNLSGWRDISNLDLANVWAVRNPPDGFLRWAIHQMGAVCVSRPERYSRVAQGDSVWPRPSPSADLGPLCGVLPDSIPLDSI